MSADPWVPSPAALPIWHLASGYASARRRRRPLWMLEVYFDDSGRGNEPVFVLAGFLSPAERWAAFNDEWQAELDRAPAIVRFKMQDAMTGGDRVWRSMRQDARLERLDRFRAILHRYALLGFACVVRHDAYNQLLRGRLKFAEPVYWLAFMGVINATMRYHRQTGLKDKVDFVFDEQKGEFRRARDSFERLRESEPYLREHVAGSPREATDDRVLPLQAADYLAWQMRRFYADQEKPAAARRLAILPPGQYLIEEGDIPIMTDVIDAAFLKRLGDERIAEDLKNLEAEDMPTRIKDYLRRVLTARLRGTPEPEPPLPETGGSDG